MIEAGDLEHPLADRHRRPQPPYELAMSIARRGQATAMIDISDGLLADLGHVAEESRVRIDLEIGAIPIADGLADAAGPDGPLAWALSGGDDHCFVATVPDGDLVLPTIGTVAALGPNEQPTVSIPGLELVSRAEYERLMASRGHEHFRS
jgi:thiamine-monophosphate kinase